MIIRELPIHRTHIIWDFTVGPYGSQVIYEYEQATYVHAKCAPDEGEYQEANPDQRRAEEGYGTCRFCQQPIIHSRIIRPDGTPMQQSTESEHFL